MLSAWHLDFLFLLLLHFAKGGPVELPSLSEHVSLSVNRPLLCRTLQHTGIFGWPALHNTPILVPKIAATPKEQLSCSSAK